MEVETRMKRRRDYTTTGRATKKRITAPYTPMTPAQQKAVSMEVQRQIARKEDYKQTVLAHSTANTVSYSGQVHDLLSNLSRGDNPVNNFEGSSLQVKSIRIRGQISAADGTQMVRLMVFQWRDPAVPVPSGLLTQAGSGFAPYSDRLWTNKKTAKILYDQLFNMDTYSPTCKVDIYIPGTKLARTWMQQSAAIAQNNGVFLLAISDSSTVNHPIWTYLSEIVFTD